MLQSAQNVTHFPGSKSDFIKGRKHASVFLIGRTGVCFKYQGQNSSVLVRDPGEQDIKEDCCCTDLRFFFFFFKPVRGDQKPLARQVLLQEKD